MSELREQKSILAKLMVSENITVRHAKVPTAGFDPKSRTLVLPILKEMEGEVYDLFVCHEVGHALYTPAEGWHKVVSEFGPNYKGFLNIGEKIVQHQARKYGETKFGMSRFINGFLDLITISFLSKFGKRPMHFFGLWGTVMFIFGLFSAGYLGVTKLYKLSQGMKAILITDNPWFYIAMVGMILGTQLFLAGFLGELILKTKEAENYYTIKEKLNY